MKRAIVLLAVVSLVLAVAVAKEPPRVFSGEYQWKDGGNDELSAEFTPNGEESWKVKFRFKFSGKNKTSKGTARGSHEDGSRLSGTATSGSRTWEFEASIEDGVMNGSHTETTGGRNYQTGTFELNR